MGMKGIEIVEKSGVNVKELIKLLNKAYSDEWLAYYQYWVGAKVVCGMPSPILIPQLEEHAEEELKHAGMLAKRIVELGGSPVLSPEEWYKTTNCGYLIPNDADARAILKQNIAGERCAIEVYNKLLEYIKGKDMITGNMIRKILEDEVEHEQDLETIALDVTDMANIHPDCGCHQK